MRAVVLIISDSTYRGNRKDTSGAKIVEYLQKSGIEIVERAVLPDEELRIFEFLKDQVTKGVDIIITTGGTGITERDITPEATRRVIEKELPGIEYAMYSIGLSKTKRSLISRAVAGVAGRSFIVNLPGSPKAIDDYMPLIIELAPHINDLLNGRTEHNHEEA